MALDLWLPILLSAVAVFVLSFILHMVLPWHHGDYTAIPNEDAVMSSLRALSIPQGEYMVPRPASPGDMKDAAFQKKMSDGPVFTLRMLPNGMPPLGTFLGKWFVYLLVVGWLAALVVKGSIHGPTTTHHIFHTAALSAFMGYSLALVQDSIWYRKPWRITIKSLIDGFLYGLATGLIFAWLWPS